MMQVLPSQNAAPNFTPLFFWVMMAGFLLLFFSSISEAQVTTNITSDNSLGTQVTPNGNFFDITGGTRPDDGPNLFHSFGQFSVGGGDTANFLNDTGAATNNILGRVTGGDPSSIYGTVQTTDFPGANLFLLNPAGVIFGPSAILNVSGSFYTSTADFVRLGEDGIFYANLGEESVLTIANPTAFGFLSDNPQGITLDQSQLMVEADKTLGLVGGDVDISGAQLTAPNGNIVLASVASPGEVTGIGGTDIQANAPQLGNIWITDQALLQTDGTSGGTVAIRGGQLVVDASTIFANTTGLMNGAANNNTGEGIDIQVTNNLRLDNGSLIQANAQPSVEEGIEFGGVQVSADHIEMLNHSIMESNNNSAGGISGGVNIEANSLRMDDGEIHSWAIGMGDSGNINIQLRDGLEMQNFSFISTISLFGGKAGDIDIQADSIQMASPIGTLLQITSQISPFSFPEGSTGNIRINTNSLQMDHAEISTATFGAGKGGNVDVNVDGDVLIAGGGPNARFTGIFSNTFGSGAGGHLQITAHNLTLTNLASLEAGTFGGSGNAGGADISLTGNLELDKGSFIQTRATGSGNAGEINITAKDITITGVSDSTDPELSPDFTGISVSTFDGEGADLNIQAENLTVRDKGFVNTATFGSGDSGDINIDLSGTLLLENGGQVFAVTRSSGNAGEIDVTADNVTLTGVNPIPGKTISGETQLFRSAITSQSDGGSGNGGIIEVVALSDLKVLDGASVTSESTLTGNAGNINLTADQTVELDKGTVSTAAQGGEGGDIGITAGQDVVLNNNTLVSAQTFGPGNAGDITLTSGHDINMSNSTISTEAAEASGGNVKLSAPNIIQLTDSRIESSVVGGQATEGGNIDLDPEFIFLTNSQILANATAGNGGNITLTATGGVFIDANSVLDASSETGISGNVTVNSPIVALAEVVAALPKNFVIPQSLFADACAAQAGGQFSSFTQGAPAALPPAPGGFLSSPLMLNNLTTPPSTGGTIQSSTLAQSRLGLDFSTISLLPAFGCGA